MVDELVVSLNVATKIERKESEARFYALNDAFVSKEPLLVCSEGKDAPYQQNSIRLWGQVGPWILQFNEVKHSRSGRVRTMSQWRNGTQDCVCPGKIRRASFASAGRERWEHRDCKGSW